jgi:hypothetical protein
MVDESRLVSADRGVDHDVVVDREKERVVALPFRIGVTRVGLGGRQSLARVFNETRSGGNPARGEGAEALYRRLANLERI